MKKAVCILSGGLDSSTCSYIAKEMGYEIITIHFSYGQRTKNRELQSFRDISNSLNAKQYELKLDLFEQIKASALTDLEIDVPTAGIKEGVPITYVPFRNGVFLSIAAAIAEKEGAEAIFIGVVEEDSSGYPDCREKFINSFEHSINLGTKDETKLKILTPLIKMKKEDIVQEALRLNVPLHLTWSCYQNEDVACGVCDSCRLRLKGFLKHNLHDLIEYDTIATDIV